MKKMFTIRDVVAGSIGPIMCFATDAPAVRAFTDVAMDPQTNVNRHPADFELICVGSIGDYGEIVDADVRVVLSGATLKAASEASNEPRS